MSHPQYNVPGFSIEQSVSNATVNGSSVDRKGYHYAQGVFRVAATDGNITTLAIQESDDDSTWTTLHSVPSASLPDANSDNDTYIVNVNLDGKKRYLRWAAVEDNTGSALCFGFFNLSLFEQAPDSAADYGSDVVYAVQA